MDYIVFDLEWNQPYDNDISFMKRTKIPVSGEIIQIGAVNMDENLQIIDEFSIFVKPKYLVRMHKYVKALTGITNQDLDRGIPFEKAFQRFVQWCGLDSFWLSWGSDDITILRENLMLHSLRLSHINQWADAQLIYSYIQHDIIQQYSVQNAMKELNITNGDLSAHNALHDAYFTARICQEIPFKKGLLQYGDIRKQSSNPFMFPKPLSFFIYENFQEKKRVLYDNRIRKSFCPFCQKLLETDKIERLQGDKYLTLGQCEQHGDFGIQLKIGKYTKKHGIINFYVRKMITYINDDIRDLYKEKAKMNREKEAKYYAKLEELKGKGNNNG